MSGLQVQQRLITLEGGEGAGKTTVLNALRDALKETGAEVVCTREPGGTPLAERIRSLLLGISTEDGYENPSPETELLLMFAARAQHVREAVLPALQRGAWVLSDRFTDSSYAYQGGGRGLDPGFIVELELRAVGIVPGLTLLLDLGVPQGRDRTRERDLAVGGNGPDRIERERDEFFERVRAAYLARAHAQPQRITVIDAAPPAQDVAAAAVRTLRAYMDGMG